MLLLHSKNLLLVDNIINYTDFATLSLFKRHLFRLTSHSNAKLPLVGSHGMR